MNIHASAEDYLEAILILQEKGGNVRSIDVARHMNFSKPTISAAMKQFRENGYIEMDDGHNISLTEPGAEIARKIYERHRLIAQILMDLGVDEETAYMDSCKIEHSISEKSFDCIKKYYYSSAERKKQA